MPSYNDTLNNSVLSDDGRPRIFLMGARRSGKSSIQKVVFHKISPHETLFLESTNEVRVKGEWTVPCSLLLMST